MGKMYDIIDNLCKQKGITVTQMCRELGISRSIMSELSSGRTMRLSAKNSALVAKYLGVSVEYLLTGGDTAAPEPASDEAVKIALFGGDGVVTDEMWQEVRRFADYIKTREAEKRVGGSDKNSGTKRD